jgi:thiol-disulfide isomerase/thioredoxin
VRTMNRSDDASGAAPSQPRVRFRAALGLLSLITVMTLAACDAGSPVVTSPPPAQDQPAEPGQPGDGDPAAAASPLAFTASNLDGAPVDTSTLEGPVVVWFWAPWCSICRSEAPTVADVAAEFEGEVTFLGIAGLGPVDDMRAFVTDTGIGGFDHLVDDDGSLWQIFEVTSQPAYAFIWADGSYVVQRGAFRDHLREQTAELVG